MFKVFVIRSSEGRELFVDCFRVRVVEKLRVHSLEERFKAINEAYWNTFPLRNKCVY